MYICKNNKITYKPFFGYLNRISRKMRKYIALAVLALSALSCKKNAKVQEQAEEMELNVVVDRYDKAFFEAKPSDLPILKEKYPFFFPPQVDERFLAEKMVHPQWRALYDEVEKRYDNFDVEKKNIETLFKYIKYYFPKTKIPKVYTVIQDMDPDYKVIYAPDKNVLIISLELYLGKSHRFYEYPEFLKKRFEAVQMMPDVVDAFALYKVKPPIDRDFLSQMIYEGKKLYLKDVLLPTTPDEDKIAYTTEELKWCEENDETIWRFMIEQKMLYDTNPMLVQKLIAPGPFSKFGLESDNQTPARIGAWIGWQIVRAYMEQNEVSLEKMLVVDAKELFKKSKYKPVKN